LDKQIKGIMSKHWRYLKKKQFVIGFDGIFQPRVRDGKVIRGTKCLRIYVSEKKAKENFKNLSLFKKILRSLHIQRSLSIEDLIPEEIEGIPQAMLSR